MTHVGTIVITAVAYIGPGIGIRPPTWYEALAGSLGLSVAQLVLLAGVFALLGLAVVFAVGVFGPSFPGRPESRAASRREPAAVSDRARRPLKPGGYI